MSQLVYRPYSGIVKPPRGSRLNMAHPLSRGLVGYYLLNEAAGATVRNEVPGHPSGTITGGGTWVSSKWGSAWEGASGGGDYIRFGWSAGGLCPKMNFLEGTVAYWVKRDFADTIDAYPTFAYLESSAGSDSKAQIFFRKTTDKFVGVLKTGGSNTTAEFEPSLIPQGVWTHVVMSWSFSQNYYRVHVNGTQEVSFAHTGTTAVAMDKCLWVDDGASDGQKSVHSIRFYNRALTTNEIHLLYRNPHIGLERRCISLVEAAAAPSGPSIPIAMYHHIHHNLGTR